MLVVASPCADLTSYAWILAYSLGYFVVDSCLVVGFYAQFRQAWSTIVHHIVVMLGLCLTAYYAVQEVWFCGLMAMFFMTEMSTPLVNARWFMHTAKAAKLGLPLLLTQVALLLVFFHFRIWAIPKQYMTVVEYLPKLYALGGFALSGTVSLAALALAILNSYWFALMLWIGIKQVVVN